MPNFSHPLVLLRGRRSRHWFGALLLSWLNLSLAGAAEWELLPAQTHHVELSVEDSEFHIRTTGNDPYLVGRWIGRPGPEDRILELEYFCAQGVRSPTAYYGPPISEASRIDLPDLTIAEGWQTYKVDLHALMAKALPPSARLLRLDLGTQPDVDLRIRGVRIRKPTAKEWEEIARADEIRNRKQGQANRIERYLQQDRTIKLDVEVTKREIVLRFPAAIARSDANDDAGDRGGQAEAFELIEYLPQDSPGDSAAGRVVRPEQYRTGVEKQQIKIVLPRQVDNWDRLHSAWQVVGQGKPPRDSGRRYPTSIKPWSDDHAKLAARPGTQKGLSGFSGRGPRQDLIDLGIEAITINLALNPFISNTPGPGKQRIHAPGPELYFDPAVFAHYDPLIDFARKHQIIVTAIVLIPRSKHATSRSPLVHPDADGGVYAMPDLSTERGVRIYAHVLDAIARRYRHRQRSPGAITNWIAHNEVDFHPVWTNMGRQPRPVYTETYYRSMRMIHNAARAHNPHARVFASLTHHWVVPDDGHWRQLAPREVIETLQQYARLEGDFGWGIAYHPYPQNLFAEVAWRDTNLRDDFETPLITIENLEVLGRFLEQDSLRDDEGGTRPVLLSEQGFHTATYDEDAQAKQAGSLWYAMAKIHRLPFVESFHYHRWIDHPDEGGLMLGLRTLPDAQHPSGQPKRAWHVYQAIGTEREREVTKGLPGP
ncbi:MAG: DUF5722 domain-containing protein [Pirellulales bacterium]|nr:DUF5722 domain-containing protein [Pirellulales bacterium]